jgi:ubiquinone/menaquinone biosynthesis C-methylase UbiE
MTFPPPLDDRKSTERLHYGRIAALHEQEISQKGMRSGPDSLPPFLQAPYRDFAGIIRSLTERDTVVVDVAAGTGVHSLAAGSDARIVALDISPESLAVARRRSELAGVPLLLAVADGETLPLRNGVTDLISSAGSLYVFDLTRLTREVARVLSPGGSWVIVDSFRHNPVYSANRMWGYLRGRRTRLAVTNIPGRQTIKLLSGVFEEVSVNYYGIFSFVGPFLSRVLGESRAAAMLDALDRRMQWAGVLAFKVVIVARRPRQTLVM